MRVKVLKGAGWHTHVLHYRHLESVLGYRAPKAKFWWPCEGWVYAVAVRDLREEGVGILLNNMLGPLYPGCKVFKVLMTLRLWGLCLRGGREGVKRGGVGRGRGGGGVVSNNTLGPRLLGKVFKL
jgi:hypothetical protein